VWARNLRTLEVTVLERPRPPGAMDEFFRCWFTRRTTTVPDALVDVVVGVARHFATREVHVVSGFRAPKYNLSLRKKGREVARASQHTQGMAIDFALPGIPIDALADHVRATHAGGVGRYRSSGFVHVDLGPRRRWDGT
jgi:uncharacterized protein YcbK (DUF882 family)